MFLNPLMLAGLGGAALPLVLHLLARARFRTVDWAAMMFLVGGDSRQHQSTKLRQLILLLLRMAMVAILAIALARPLVSDSFAAVASGGQMSAVLVIDSSLSTATVENHKARSDLIHQQAMQILSSLHKGDEAAIIVAGGTANRSSEQLSTDLPRLADVVSSLQPTGQANLAEALARAADLLNHPEYVNRRLYVLCDRQAVSWREVDAAFRSAWRTRAQHDAIPTPLYILPIGQATSTNLAIAGVTVTNPPIIREQPIDLSVKVRNFGGVRRAGVTVALSIAGHEIGRASADLSPGATISLPMTARLGEAGPAVLTAAIMNSPDASTGLAADDSRDLAIDVAEPTRVLILSGDERSLGQGSTPPAQVVPRPRQGAESYFATVALQPYAAAGKNGPDPCRVTVVPSPAATSEQIDAAQVIVLANVPTLSPMLATHLEQFIYEGGGLLVAPGSLTQAANLNDLLYRNGAGPLPAGLGAKQSPAEPGTLGIVDTAHPALKFLQGRPDLPSTAVFSQWFKLSPLRSDARIIASMSHSPRAASSDATAATQPAGDPWAVECVVGRGRVMLLAGPLDADWSTLPLTSFYLPFVQSSVRWLAGSPPDRNLPAGTPIEFVWTAGDFKSTTLLTPDGRTVALEPQRTGDRSQVRFADTARPGLYRLRLAATKGRDTWVPFVVQNPPDESDPAPMKQADWQTLGKDLRATLIEPSRQSIADVLNAPRSGREIGGLLVLMVIAVGLLETWLAGRWSRQE